MNKYELFQIMNAEISRRKRGRVVKEVMSLSDTELKLRFEELKRKLEGVDVK